MASGSVVAPRTDTRALRTYVQAVLVLRWLFDDARMLRRARDSCIGVSTAYAYRDEAIIVLAARKPPLHGALLAAKAAGHTDPWDHPGDWQATENRAHVRPPLHLCVGVLSPPGSSLGWGWWVAASL